MTVTYKKYVSVLIISLIISTSHFSPIYPQTTKKTAEDYCKEADEFLKAKQYQGAIATYKKIIELFPNNDLGYDKIEKLYLALDRFDEADNIYKEYLDRLGDGELMRIMLLAKFGKTDSAIGSLLKMISFKPEYAPAASYLGTIYREQGKYLRAKIYLENALDIIRRNQGDLKMAKRIEEELKVVLDKSPAAPEFKLKTFSNPQEKISIEYPSDWYVKEEKSGDLYAVFLSREKISKSSDIFKAGITIMKFHKADQFEFDMPPNKIRLFPDLVYGSMALYIDAFCTQLMMQNQLSFRAAYRTKINNIPSCIAEVSLRSEIGSPVTMFLVVSYKDNAFVKLVLEAPVEEFEQFYPIFKNIINNVKFF